MTDMDEMDDVVDHPYMSGKYSWVPVRTRCRECLCVVDRIVSMVLHDCDRLRCFICRAESSTTWLASSSTELYGDEYGTQYVMEGGKWCIEYPEDALPIPAGPGAPFPLD